jgi:uncharacterized protein (DUF2062 family)
MTLSDHERQQWDLIETDLAHDPRLSAVARLFAQRPARTGSDRRLRLSRTARSAVLAAVAGLLCALVAVPLDHPVAAAVAVTAAVCGGVTFMVTTVRHLPDRRATKL